MIRAQVLNLLLYQFIKCKFMCRKYEVINLKVIHRRNSTGFEQVGWAGFGAIYFKKTGREVRQTTCH